jgi:S1-C subfamily serine protease
MEFGDKQVDKVREIRVQALSGGWKAFIVIMFVVILAQLAYIVYAGMQKTTVIWKSTSGRPIPASYEASLPQSANIGTQYYQAPSDIYWIADLAEKSLPFVVNIRTETVPKEQPAKPNGNGNDGEMFKEMPQNPQSTDPMEQFRQFFEDRGFNSDQFDFRQYHDFDNPLMGDGSGFIVSQDGYIVTNAHVFADFNKFTITLNDGKEYPGKLIGRDYMKDVSVIKIEATGLSFAALGDSDRIRPGEPAIAIGSPFGLKHTVTSGIVSAIGRLPQDINMPDDPRSNRELIQTDAAINPGNSGGPLLNAKGEVIGVNQSIIYGANRIGFAIPINSVKRSIESIIKNGDVRYPGMAISIEDLLTEWADQYQYDVKEGVLVREVTKGMSGDQAGLRAGDVITAIQGKPIKTRNELIAEIQTHDIGDKITLTVYPQGKKPAKDVLVVLGELNLA